MNYQETLQWLFTQLPMYQREGKAAYKANLDNTLALDAHLGHPHQQFKTIHIAGTNGKGSVSHLIASILQEAGYKTGLYTSPHLKDFRERIRINGKMISEQTVVEFVAQNKNLFSKLKPSFFEMTVAMAFDYFARQQVDVAVVEVGLGGRLDSTNIISPLVSVITNISPDHVALLGDTLPQIATEKAGIIKPHIPVVVGTRDEAYDYVFIETAKKQEAPISFVSDSYHCQLNSDANFDITTHDGESWINLSSQLKGFYQCQNIPTAIETVRQLIAQGLTITTTNIHNGIAKVIDNTHLLGRWQILNQHPLTICDTGHNIAGITQVVQQINACKFNRLHFVIGMVNDKDISGVLQLLPKDATYYFCKASIPRAMPEKELAVKANEIGLQGNSYPTVTLAYQAAQQNALPNDLIFIGGSTFTVAEVV